MANDKLAFLSQLEQIIGDRIDNPSEESYTASLVAMGPKRVAQKVGEEAVELALAAVDGEDEEVLSEAADLVYHLLLLLNVRSVTMNDVVNVLETRHTG